MHVSGWVIFPFFFLSVVLWVLDELASPGKMLWLWL